MRKHILIGAIAILGMAIAGASHEESLDGSPLATIDLATGDGVRLVKGQWRYSDTRIVETEFRSVGADNQPTGGPVRTYDFTPHAGETDYDDSAWEQIEAESLPARRGRGRLSFNWYRIRITVPELSAIPRATGSTVVFETSVDDYAEIWVDGELTRVQGQSGGSVIAGWNSANRLVIGRNAKPGDRIQLAIFGINGPISDSPTNYIFMRSARLAFYAGIGSPVALPPSEVNVSVKRLDPRLDEVVGRNPKLFKLAAGFQFTEGPVWDRRANRLLFSDPNANTIYQFVPAESEAGKLSVFRAPSGYAGSDIAEYGQPGSNGLTLDPQGRLTANEHGNHRVTRTEADGTITVLADSYRGKRLNSPNDLVYRSDGTLFFTDPPFGLPKFGDDPRKALPYSGIYSWRLGELKLLDSDFNGPNGIALSPDEKFLYVANWDEKRKQIKRYRITSAGTLDQGEMFFDMTSAPGEDALDGVKVDVRGNLYVSGPGGLWIIAADGTHLGTIVTPRHPHNFAWGGDDGKTLYITARSALYRMPLGVAGTRP